MNKLRVFAVVFFVLSFFPGVSFSFPGEELGHFLTELGDPANLKGGPSKEENQAPKGDYKNDRFIHYYWLGTEMDPLLTGKKIKGNFIVIFEKQKGGQLKSQQETFLSQIAPDDFKLLQEKIKPKWNMISKSHHENPQRSYDLYQLVSKDEQFQGEISYSPLDKIIPFKSNEANLPAPVFYLSIHILPKK